MDNINRGRFLELSVLLVLATISGGLPLIRLKRRKRSYFLITDRPTGDLERLLQLTRTADGSRASIQWAHIRPTLPDVGIIENGRLINPIQAGVVEPKLRDFVYELRSRKRAGEHLIKIESRRLGGNDLVVFSVDGEIVDQVSLRNNYRQIVIAGRRGSTSFELHDGYLSVAKTSCRHEICKKMGKINLGRIICAPNKLVATIDPSQHLVDGITG